LCLVAGAAFSPHTHTHSRNIVGTTDASTASIKINQSHECRLALLVEGRRSANTSSLYWYRGGYWYVDAHIIDHSSVFRLLGVWCLTRTSFCFFFAVPPPVTSVAIDEASPNKTNDGATTTTTTAPEVTQRQYIGFKRALLREWKIILLSIIMLICMNIPYLKYLLYPFDIFSTWIHEMCHGIAGLMVGGKIVKLLIYPDTSGLAYVQLPSSSSSQQHQAFVTSAGYQGTAVVGFLLLTLRRTKRGPRCGLFLLAFWMMLSVALWIRNWFGLVMIPVLGFLFLLAAWKLSSIWMRAFYTVICVTVSLNAIAHAYELFGSSAYVNGQPSATDATTMAELKGGTHWMWASIWLSIAMVLTLFGIVFAIPGPQEDPAFRCCGMCLDCGLFWICNGTRKKKGEMGSETNGTNGSAVTPATDP
jgi:Peptidase M50B-like